MFVGDVGKVSRGDFEGFVCMIRNLINVLSSLDGVVIWMYEF